MITEQQQYADTVTQYATTAQYLGSGAAVLFGLTLNEWAALVGILVGIGGFIVNTYYKRESKRMEREKHELELEILRANKVTYHKADES